MKRRLRRLLYLLFFLLWLLLMALPLLGVILAVRQQIEIGDVPGNQLRLFLLQEVEVRGVGVEWTRPAQGTSGCVQTTLTYLLWRGKGENARYCRCYDGTGNLRDSYPGSCRLTERTGSAGAQTDGLAATASRTVPAPAVTNR